MSEAVRVKVRQELDFEQKINVRKLSPLMKIYAGIVVRWRETEFYRRKLNRSLEDEAVLQMQKDEQLKEILLAQIFKELGSNSRLESEGKQCKSIVISVEAKYHKSLERVLKHRDFLPYRITFVSENADLRKAFKDMPYLLSVEKRLV